jgi:hexokinase
MSCAWKDDRCRIGLILGTGTNACFLEEIKDIHTIDKEKYQDQVINSIKNFKVETIL